MSADARRGGARSQRLRRAGRLSHQPWLPINRRRPTGFTPVRLAALFCPFKSPHACCITLLALWLCSPPARSTMLALVTPDCIVRLDQCHACKYPTFFSHSSWLKRAVARTGRYCSGARNPPLLPGWCSARQGTRSLFIRCSTHNGTPDKRQGWPERARLNLEKKSSTEPVHRLARPADAHCKATRRLPRSPGWSRLPAKAQTASLLPKAFLPRLRPYPAPGPDSEHAVGD